MYTDLPHDVKLEEVLAIENASATAETLLDIADRINDKRIIDESTMCQLRLASEQAYLFLGKDDPAKLSLESFKHTRTHLAVENILESVLDIVKSLGSKISWYVKKEIDSLEQWYTFFEGQSSKMHDIDSKISGFYGNNVMLRTTNTKYVRYGSNVVVRDFPDYADKYLRMSEVMVNANNAIVKLKDKDWLQSWKVFLSPITGYDDKYVEQWTNLNDFVLSIKDAVKAKPRTQTNFLEMYSSETLLGMSHFEFKLPKSSSYDRKYVDSMKKVHANMWVEFTRDEKFEIGSFSNDVILAKATKKDLQKCATASYDIIHSYKELMSLKNKLNHIGEVHVIADAMYTALYPLAWWKALLANYRIMVRISSLQYFITSSMFNFSRGNVAKFMNIVDKNM